MANINLSAPDEEQIHEQFIKGGIDTAAELLINYEVETVDVLAFSVGGTIWKAGLNGLKIRNLYLVSATRIRYEVEKPDCNISLYYGEFENFKPSQFWFESMNLNYISIKDGGHNIYSNAGTALEICSHITDRLFKDSAKTV
ncbi:hypothetical protein [Dyadobacter sp. NIV53]|uniref:hypothetical protein n=1 Tax=Dyadobacter sp. NIV53 TaxID=2861765 RepID=UPI001C8696BB|nr:hypothetical protein [Dyadobacter sp. NIV53]